MRRSRQFARPVAAILAAAFLVQACGDDDDGPSGPAATTYTLTITLTGIGTGAVTSSPAGIDCSTAGGSGCTATFDAGTRVTLTATPAPGMAFGGWSGDGTGTTTRTVTMDRDRAVSAAFDDSDKAVQDIGAEGGTIASRDGAVVLTIPAGALSSATEITIEKIDPEDLGAEWDDYRDRIDAVYEFGPDGLTFAAPATVTFDAAPIGVVADTIRVALQAIMTSEEGAPVPLEDLTVEVDVAAGTATVSGQVSHFSPLVLLGMDQSGTLKVWGPSEVEVGKDFTVAITSEEGDVLLEPSLANGTEAVEQVGEPTSSPVPPFPTLLPLRCNASGSHIYHLDVAVAPDSDMAFLVYIMVKVPNLRVQCVSSTSPPPPAGPRFTELGLSFVSGLESMSFLAPGFIPVRGSGAFPDVAASSSLSIGRSGAGAARTTVAGRKGPRAAVAGPMRQRAGDAAPMGPLASALADGDDCPALLVAGEGGAAAIDPCDGTVLGEYRVVGSANFDALAMPVPEGGTGSPAMMVSGVGAYACDVFETGELGLCVLRSGTFVDAVPIADDPSAGAIVVRYPGVGSQLEFIRFSPDRSIFDWVPGAVTIPALSGAGMLKSAVAGGAPAGAFTPPDEVVAVAAMNEGPGKVFHIDLTGAEPAITEVGELVGTDPRRIRCDLGSGICAISDFSGSRITVLLWDGTGVPTIADVTDAGAIADGPVGIDVLGHRIVSVGFNDAQYSIIEVDESGEIVSVKTDALPAGCVKPGHVRFLRDAANTIVASCWDSNGIAVVPEAF